MNDLRFYVYVYCNPLKPGIYSYQENGIGIDFPCAPFYIGKGKDLRLNDHLNEANRIKKYEAESIQEEKPKYNRHKVNTINKIHREGKEVVIYKICENLEEETSYLLERFFIKMIGRADKKLGILTNMRNGGDGGRGLSKENEEKRVQNYKKTINNIPDYEKKKKVKEMETKRNDPSIMKNAGKKASKTKKDNPEIVENQVKNLKITLEQNPDIKLNANKKLSENWENKTPDQKQEKINNIKQAFKDNPDIIVKQKEKEMKTKNDDPSIMKRAGEKGGKKRIENKVNVGKSHAGYVELDISFILQYYFDIIEITELFELYNKNHNHILGYASFYRILKILQIPANKTKYSKQRNIYLKFVEENKDKIEWYIENYERLEEEYFLQKHYNKHEEFFNTNK